MKKLLLFLVISFIGINAASAAVYLDQATTTTGTANVLRSYRVPVSTSTGIKYYDMIFAFTQDATGKPVLAPNYPSITLSPILLVG